MTINERIKLFRNSKKLNQKQLASLLGVTQSGISYMEQNGSTISESSIKTICSIFHLNEDWLRNGFDPMYIQPSVFSLDDFISECGADDLELSIIKAYFELDRDVRQMLISHFKNRLFGSGNVIYDDIPDTPETLERRFGTTEEEKNSGAG